MSEKPQTFPIRTLGDIFNLPTFEQMETCLDELSDAMKIARATGDLMISLADNIAQKGESMSIQWPEMVEWVDDGKGEVGASFLDGEGNVLLEVE